jgi:hypothetical protein
MLSPEPGGGIFLAEELIRGAAFERSLEKHTSGAEARIYFYRFTARVELVPFPIVCVVEVFQV